MSSERWERVKQLLDEAVRLPVEQRDSYLEKACGSDSALRAEVASLISSHDEAGSQFLAEGAPEILKLEVSVPATASRQIDQYQLIERVGQGGMGQVWLAEQTTPVERKVALKLMRGGMFDDELLKRFKMERQSLAIMDHPSIAKVFDAGATAEGQPYFVMEYVSGLPITDYCDQKRLTIRKRLELFIKVCDGVQHAHQKSIVHRDLKPANILVQEVDGQAVPRIIDFGLAKAVHAGLTGDSLYTQTGHFVGTPGYMSPEQADPEEHDVDTRSDVYSLGVVLYVLLTGALPFETTGKKKPPLDEVLRQLREEDPPTPSTKARNEAESTETAAEARGTEPRQLVRLLRGDLDWITMKALERDRSRRYATPTEFSADIARYLASKPVEAHPGSVWYRAAKYARRHSVGVAVAMGLAVLLTSFAILQVVQLRRTTRERDRETRITEFMTKMFKVSDPSEARGNTVTAREILDKASREIETGLAKDPEVQAHMMYVMGEVYDSLGLFPQSRSLLQRAVEVQRRVLGRDNPETLRTAGLLGSTLLEAQNYTEAEEVQRETLAAQRRVLGPEHPDTLHTMSRLAGVLNWQTRYSEAEKLYRETLEIQRRVLGAEHPDTMNSMTNLAMILWLEGQAGENGQKDTSHAAEAEQLARESLALHQRSMGPDHPDTLNVMSYLSNILTEEGRLSEAEEVSRETLAIDRRVLGPEHIDTLVAMNNLAVLLAGQQKYAEAENLYRETRSIQQRVLGPEDPDTALSTYNLACLAAVQGQREEALALLTESVDHLRPFQALRLDQDDDLKSLHGDPRYAALVARAKARIAASQSKN